MDYRLEIGDLTFDNDKIIIGSIDVATAVDIAGNELSVDTLSCTVIHEPGQPVLFAPKGYSGVLTADGMLFGTRNGASLKSVPYGADVRLYADNQLRYAMRKKDAVRVGKNQYEITAISPIGLLDTQEHMGGMYVGARVRKVVSEIIDGAFEYGWVPSAAPGGVPLDLRITGWLPKASKRDNLHQVLFAVGLSVFKNSTTGQVTFGFLSDNDVTPVGNDRIFIGGQISYPSPATAVEVAEHHYYTLPSTPEEVLFDNTTTVAADNTVVNFAEPCYALRAEGSLTIQASGCNYAVVSGVGVLYGRKYTHQIKTVTASKAGATSAANIIRCTDCTMISSINAENVAKRLLAYYGSRKGVRADLKLEGEKAGTFISFEDAFGDDSVGVIERVDATASSFIRGSAQIIADYTPVGMGNTFMHSARITKSGLWPIATTGRIRLIAIGGGQGGQGGYDGSPGMGGQPKEWGGDFDYADTGTRKILYYGSHPERGGKGGDPGAGGKPGRVYAIDIAALAGDMLRIIIGAGGAGGEPGGGEGGEGDDTVIQLLRGNVVISEYSSADGYQSADGYHDQMQGGDYALPGVAGYRGADGGSIPGPNDSYSGWMGNGDKGASTTGRTGGNGGIGMHIDDEHISVDYAGGGGGGAASGTNGGAGAPGSLTQQGDDYTLSGGPGGNGADAVAPAPQTSYGSGGRGGHGGGGGGNGGGCSVQTVQGYSVSNFTIVGGNPGAGGKGSRGGDGGNGIAEIYY